MAADNHAAADDTMNAIVQDAYGPVDVLRSGRTARPDIAGNEVLVRVHAAGMDRGTWHMMTGRPYLMRILGFGFRRPKNRVPGIDVAGTVVAVGSAVTRFAVGDEVFGIVPGRVRRVRRRAGGQAGPQALEPDVRTGRRRSDLGGNRPSGAVRRGPGRARPEGADHRRLRRRRHLRRAAGQGPRRRGHRRVQRRPRSIWCGRSAPTTSSTTRRRTSPTVRIATT